MKIEQRMVRGQLVDCKVLPPQKYAKGGKEVHPTGAGAISISWDYWTQPGTEATAKFKQQQRAKYNKILEKRAVKVLITQLYDERHSIEDIMEATGKTEKYVRTVLFGYEPGFRS